MVKNACAEMTYCDFPESNWHEILENVSISTCLDEQEKKKIGMSPVARLLAALPWFAGCENPDQLAVLKVGMYVAGVRNPGMFAHRENQSVRERLLPGTMCPGGDPVVVEMVTSFLELISINDHLRDFEEDMKTGHPNPVGANILFFYSRRDKLIFEIENSREQELVQRLMKICNPILVGFWTATWNY